MLKEFPSIDCSRLPIPSSVLFVTSTVIIPLLLVPSLLAVDPKVLIYDGPFAFESKVSNFKLEVDTVLNLPEVDALTFVPKEEDVDTLRELVVPELRLFDFCSPGSAINSIGIKLVCDSTGEAVKHKIDKNNLNFI
tara:strand:+ start:73 stop:480 length:408 start_codon:yes stop_codon:yes gene_type:complete